MASVEISRTNLLSDSAGCTFLLELHKFNFINGKDTDMTPFRAVFSKKHTLLVVVHAENIEQSVRNARIAHDEGADGIFLINHRISASDLLRCYRVVREVCLEWWIGANFLDLDNESAIQTMAGSGISGLWLDDAGVREDEVDPCTEIRTLRQWQKLYGVDLAMLFGGVAFKYQKPVKDPARVAQLAAPHIDVVTTSGDGTGIAADVEKIRLMKQAIGDRPLAVASGITPENVSQYLPYADCFLVATGVSKNLTELDQAKVGKLVRAIAA